LLHSALCSQLQRGSSCKIMQINHERGEIEEETGLKG
jgi:hypothetical protein